MAIVGIVLVTASALCSAAYRPILYENKTYKQNGEKKAEADIDVCLKQADKHMAKYKKERVKKTAARCVVTAAAACEEAQALRP